MREVGGVAEGFLFLEGRLCGASKGPGTNLTGRLDTFLRTHVLWLLI